LRGKGVWRAVRGELYLLLRRRSVRRAHLLIAVVAILHVIGSVFLLQAQAGLKDLPVEQLAGWNLWPRLAASSRAAMFLVEVTVLALVAGGLPREIDAGITRDPLTRQISRSAYVLARSLSGLLLPLTLYLLAVACAWGTSAIFFDPGPVLDDGDIILDEADISQPIKDALLHGIPSILALGAFSSLLSVSFRRGVVAVGCGLGVVLLARVVQEPLGEQAPWFFADTLAGLGPDSFLEQAAGYSLGFMDFYPQEFDAKVAIGWIAPLPTIGLCILLAGLLFRRRSL
jgi:hypothetical protein